MNRKLNGFTLIELILVIAIIVVLASTTLTRVHEYKQDTNTIGLAMFLAQNEITFGYYICLIEITKEPIIK